MTAADQDLESMTREELEEQVVRLRAGIRTHRSQSGHALCWYQPELWSLVPGLMTAPVVPPWPEFMAGCVAYRRSLDT